MNHPITKKYSKTTIYATITIFQTIVKIIKINNDINNINND